jgi:hypothetical protein
MSDIGTQTAFAKNFKEVSKERHSPKRTEYLEQERAVLRNVMRLVVKHRRSRYENAKIANYRFSEFCDSHSHIHSAEIRSRQANKPNFGT